MSSSLYRRLILSSTCSRHRENELKDVVHMRWKYVTSSRLESLDPSTGDRYSSNRTNDIRDKNFELDGDIRANNDTLAQPGNF